MFAQIMYVALFVIIAESVLSALANFGRAILCDIRRIKQLRSVKFTSRQQKARPNICVIIYSYNSADSTLRTLQSILRQAYKNYQVIVVDNNSTDQTVFRIRKFSKGFSKKNIRLIAKKKESSRPAAILQAIKVSTAADLVLVMDAGCILKKDTLHKANKHFMHNPRSEALIPNIQILHHDTISGLLQQARQRLNLSAKKALRFNGLVPANNYAAFYRNRCLIKLKKESPSAINDTGILDDFLKRQKNKPELAFDEQIVVCTNPLPYKLWLAQKFSGQNTLRNKYFNSPKNIILFFQPLVIVYVFFIAVRYQAYDYLLLAFFTFSILLFLNITFDRSLRPLAKVRAFFMVIPIYSVYITDNLITTLTSPLYFIKRRRQVSQS